MQKGREPDSFAASSVNLDILTISITRPLPHPKKECKANAVAVKKNCHKF